METFELIMCILLVVFAVFLIIAVLMQHGKAKNLSGTIAGGAENFLGKTKAKKWDKLLNKLTTIVSIAFVVIVLVVFIIQPDVNYNISTYPESFSWSASPYYDANVVSPAETTAAAETTATPETTAAPTEG